MDAGYNEVTHDGAVVGCLRAQRTTTSIGVIAKEWGE